MIPAWANDDYWAGYFFGLENPAEASQRRMRPDVWTDDYRLGLQDALTGAEPKDPRGIVPPPGALPPRVRPAPAYTPRPAAGRPTVFVPPPGTPVPAPPLSLVPGNFPVFEVYAHAPLRGGIPLDVAEQLRRQSGTSWLGLLANSLIGITVLGADPRDHRSGFRLSGPQGRLARQIAEQIRAGQLYAYPTSYGLDAWYGAQTTRGVRLLSRQELQALGLQ